MSNIQQQAEARNNIRFDQALYKKLTDREIEIARFAKEGMTCKDTGLRMGITASTVGTFRSRIMEKTGRKNITEAVVALITAGIL